MQTASSWNHDVSLSGGTDKTKFYSSVNYISTFYDIWVGDSVKISLSLSVMVVVYFVTLAHGCVGLLLFPVVFSVDGTDLFSIDKNNSCLRAQSQRPRNPLRLELGWVGRDVGVGAQRITNHGDKEGQ